MGAGTRLVTHDLCTSNSAKNVREHWARALGWNLPDQLRLQADAIGEQQSKRMQLGSSS